MSVNENSEALLCVELSHKIQTEYIEVHGYDTRNCVWGQGVWKWF